MIHQRLFQIDPFPRRTVAEYRDLINELRGIALGYDNKDADRKPALDEVHIMGSAGPDQVVSFRYQAEGTLSPESLTLSQIKKDAEGKTESVKTVRAEPKSNGFTKIDHMSYSPDENSAQSYYLGYRSGRITPGVSKGDYWK